MSHKYKPDTITPFNRYFCIVDGEITDIFEYPSNSKYMNRRKFKKFMRRFHPRCTFKFEKIHRVSW